jgi:hypothetical protein
LGWDEDAGPDAWQQYDQDVSGSRMSLVGNIRPGCRTPSPERESSTRDLNGLTVSPSTRCAA